MHPINDWKIDQGSVGIHWFGQSSYALKDDQGTVVMIDPYFPRERSLERFIQPVAPVDEATLRTDYVLLTHNHRDHTCIETLQRIHQAWPNAKIVGPQESVVALNEAGISEGCLQTVDAGQVVDLGPISAHAVYAKPPEGDPQNGIDPPDVTHLGFVVRASGVSLYFSGDPINTFAERDDLVDAVRTLRPDIGFLTTHPTEGEFPFFDGSVKMALKIGLKTAVPAHYACFVKRNYDPREWAQGFPADGPRTIIIPYNGSIVYNPS